MSGDDTDYLTCMNMPYNIELNLYPFVSLTDEEWKSPDYSEKLALRQIPADMLEKMTAMELVFQFVSCDMSRGMYLYNSSQEGFVAMTGQLNMLPELLSRSDAATVLIGLLQHVEPAEINGTDCLHLYECLQRIIAQREVVNRMTDDDMDKYITLVMRHQEKIIELSDANGKWSYPESLAAMMFGLGNIMLSNEYAPFLHLVETEPGISRFMEGDNLRDKRLVSLINDCITGFTES
jgi:hypothetical protein